MQIMDFIKTYWKWILIGLMAFFMLVWFNSMASAAKKMWQMTKDWIVEDQVKIIKEKEAAIKEITSEKEKLAARLTAIQRERNALAKENAKLNEQKRDLEKKIAALRVPDQPDDIVRGLRDAGLGSAKIRNMP